MAIAHVAIRAATIARIVKNLKPSGRISSLKSKVSIGQISVLKWQQRAVEQKSAGKKDPPKPPTLHVKPEQRFAILARDSSSEDEYQPLVHYRMTMPDPYDEDDDNDNDTLTVTDEVETFTPPLTVTAILAGVDRQLANYPVGHDADDVEMRSADADNLEIMDAHVRAVLAGATSRLSVLNTALGHDPSLFPVYSPG